jgi:methylmalonyl-CoA/ethylmalonyl-CoA epimerase
MRHGKGFSKIASLGPVMQLAYVPVDFDQALDFWTKTMGVGPFLQLKHIRVPSARYRGRATQFDFSVSLAQWNDLQIELIQAHDDVPSVYTEWLKSGHEGLHHVCLLVDDMKHARSVCQDAAVEVVQEIMLDGGEAIYVDTGGGPGTLVEILQAPAGLYDLFDAVRAASHNWDGQDPLRVVG